MLNIVKFSLVSVLTLGLFSLPSFAQDSDDSVDSDADVEEVIVTGSRIGRSEYSGINPVTLITSEDIEASGQLNISEVLRSTVQNTLGSTYEGFQMVVLIETKICVVLAQEGPLFFLMVKECLVHLNNLEPLQTST